MILLFEQKYMAISSINIDTTTLDITLVIVIKCKMLVKYPEMSSYLIYSYSYA